MALQVPIYQQQVRNAGPTDTRLGLRANPDTFGAAVGEGISNLGKAGVGLALTVEEVAQRERQKAERIVVDKAINDTAMKFSPIMAGARNTRGTDAMAASEKALPQFDKFADDAEAGLATEDQRAAFRQWRMGERLQHQSVLDNHAVLGQRQQDDENFAVDAVSFQQNVTDNYNDPYMVERAIEQRVNNIYNYADRNGRDRSTPEGKAWIEAKSKDEVSKAHSIVVAQMILGNDDIGAQKYFDETRLRMTPEDRLNNQARVERASIDGQSKRFSLQVLDRTPAETETPDLVAAQKMAEELTATSSQEVHDETLARTFSQMAKRSAAYKSGQESTEAKILDLVFYQQAPLGKDSEEVKKLMSGLSNERRFKMDTVFRDAELGKNKVDPNQSTLNLSAIRLRLSDPTQAAWREKISSLGGAVFAGKQDPEDAKKYGAMDWRLTHGDFAEAVKLVEGLRTGSDAAHSLIDVGTITKQVVEKAAGSSDPNDPTYQLIFRMVDEEMRRITPVGKRPDVDKAREIATKATVEVNMRLPGVGGTYTATGPVLELTAKKYQAMTQDMTPQDMVQLQEQAAKRGDPSIRGQMVILEEMQGLKNKTEAKSGVYPRFPMISAPGF